jgi:hypothetical protein
MVYSQERLAKEQRQTPGQASPSESARGRRDDRFDQLDGARSGTASIHSIHAFGRKGNQPVSARPTLARRIFRTVSRFMIAVLIGVSGTLAWQSYGDIAREMVATRAPTLGFLLSYLSTKSPAAASPNPAASSLDTLRRSVEQLAVKQDQMAQHITILQTIEEDIRQKMSFTPPSGPTVPTQLPPPIVQQKPAARAPVPLTR